MQVALEDRMQNLGQPTHQLRCPTAAFVTGDGMGRVERLQNKDQSTGIDETAAESLIDSVNSAGTALDDDTKGRRASDDMG